MNFRSALAIASLSAVCAFAGTVQAGESLNGTALNGVSMNGVRMNGSVLEGTREEQVRANGKHDVGISTSGEGDGLVVVDIQ